MRAERAAAYLDIGTTFFFEMVDDGRMPPPVKMGKATLWDRLELDAAFDNLKDRPGSESTLKRRLREMRQGNEQPPGHSEK
jgi:predicted DNA-binding transcriptional regulator AlpA